MQKILYFLSLSYICLAHALPIENNTQNKTILANPVEQTKLTQSMNSNKKIIVKQPIDQVNKIVAYVNKGVITINQLDNQITEIMQQFRQKSIEIPPQKELRGRVLEQLIMQKIQLDLATKANIKVNDIELSDAIHNMLKVQKADLNTFKSKLASQGISFESFREQIKNQMILERLKQREVDARVSVNEDEVNRILKSEAYKDRIDYNLSYIVININEQNSSQSLRDKQELANKAYQELKNGAQFSKVSIKYSTAPNALNGGELGWRNNAALPPILTNALKEKAVGFYSEVLNLPGGFFIFKINEIRKHGTLQIVKQYHVRHILIKVNETNSDEEAHHKILEIKSQLDADLNNPNKLNQDFIKLAKQYSEDTSSINGGDLGWVATGDTVPVFEQTILKMHQGLISDAIRTPYGWHILQVLGSRNSNLTNDKEKADILQELHNNKANLMYSQWLRDIREIAYVKINDN